MPNLSSSEKIKRYKRKIKNLEKSAHNNKRRRFTLPISDSDESDTNQGVNSNKESITPDTNSPIGEANLSSQMNEDDPAQSTSESTPPISESVPAVESSLDPELLAALGESTSENPDFGASIHDSLANLWLPILQKGMSKENKEKLLKEHLVPNNCKLLQAPKLNAEISAAVSEGVRGRDRKYVAVQQQLGQGITAVNRAMDTLLKSDNKVEALRHLSDGCRILSDLHYFFTKDRVKLVSPSLDKNIIHVIQDIVRDETLFGNTLSENIKASKAIEKQSQQIKKTVNIAKNNISQNTNARSAPSQGNWSGPPRYQTNRGGRGGGRKTNPPGPATRRPYFSTTTIPHPAAQNKPRAPARQH